jgi:hypothetical protein
MNKVRGRKNRKGERVKRERSEIRVHVWEGGRKKKQKIKMQIKRNGKEIEQR